MVWRLITKGSLKALTKPDLCSLDLVTNRLFIKLFKTSDIEIVNIASLYLTL